MGVTIKHYAGDESEIRQAIDNNVPVIVFVKTGDLAYWPDNTSHAIVVVGYDDEVVFLNDPVFVDSPMRAGWGEFILAWSEHDYMLALVEL